MKDWMREYRIAEVLFPKPFNLYNAGLYDYKMVKDLPWEKYREFVLKFFQCRNEPHRIAGVELDEDISGENRAKLKYAREHFNRVNSLQSECRYYFKFLSPQSYDLFFQSLREGQYRDFKSEIEANLEVDMITGDRQ
jgi:hypothetical protein